MYKFLTSKKGFTLVELMIVLVLLSLGVFAIGNLFLAAYRSFNKTEERYLKQEAVKTVAQLLQTGSAGVSAASTADVFDTISVVPTGSNVDEGFSYLFAKEHYNDDGEIDGYLVSVLDAGSSPENAKQLSDVPIYIKISVYQQSDDDGNLLTRDVEKDGEIVEVPKNHPAVTITIAALEDDYDYNSGDAPISDDIYYSLDVTYHFPNMAESDTGVTVNALSETTLSSANTYTESGEKSSHVYAENEGVVLRVYCDSIISGADTNADLTLPSLCFIATASYGEDSGEVGMLCDFRDKCLLTNPLGEAFVKAYYKLSPPIADIIRESEFLKGAVRTALKPLIVVAEYSLNEDIRPVGAISLVVFMLSGTAATLMLMRVDKRKKSR